MVHASLRRAVLGEKVVREFTLPDDRCMLKIPVVDATMTSNPLDISPDAVEYVTVTEHDYRTVEKAINQANITELTFETCMAVVNRYAGGIPLLQGNLLTVFRTPAHLWPIMAAAALVERKRAQCRFDRSQRSVYWKYLPSPIGVAYDTLTAPARAVYGLFTYQRATSLVSNAPTSVVQTGYAKFGDREWLASVHVHGSIKHGCPICTKYDFGSQVMLCKAGEDTFTFSLTDKQASEYKARLIMAANEETAAELAAVLKAAAKAFPDHAFSHTANICYFDGGPGSGKSHTIRAIIDAETAANSYNPCAVVAPFIRLGNDYDFAVDDNQRYRFKTMHKALTLGNVRDLMFDEFQAIPYELIAAITYLTSAKMVYLAGDRRQLSVQPEEGLNPVQEIPLDRVRSHVMYYNFRNGADVVACLREKFAYVCGCYRGTTDHSTISVVKRAPNDGIERYAMAFSRQVAEAMGCATVRQSVGLTKDHAILYIDGNVDKLLLQQDAQLIVAISRHRKSLVIVTDDAEATISMLDRLSIGPAGYTASIECALEPAPVQRADLSVPAHLLEYVPEVTKADLSVVQAAPLSLFQDVAPDDRQRITDTYTDDLKRPPRTNVWRETDPRLGWYEGNVYSHHPRNGQLKLLTADMEFLEHVFNNGDLIVVVGCSPGHHYAQLIEVFDSAKWLFVGPEPPLLQGLCKPGRGKVAYLNTKAEAFLHKLQTKEIAPDILICDFRNPPGTNASSDTSRFGHDMLLQASMATYARHSSLKFTLPAAPDHECAAQYKALNPAFAPYAMDQPFAYPAPMPGGLRYQYGIHNKATEMRLWVSGTEAMCTYDPVALREQALHWATISLGLRRYHASKFGTNVKLRPIIEHDDCDVPFCPEHKDGSSVCRSGKTFNGLPGAPCHLCRGTELPVFGAHLPCEAENCAEHSGRCAFLCTGGHPANAAGKCHLCRPSHDYCKDSRCVQHTGVAVSHCKQMHPKSDDADCHLCVQQEIAPMGRARHVLGNCSCLACCNNIPVPDVMFHRYATRSGPERLTDFLELVGPGIMTAEPTAVTNSLGRNLITVLAEMCSVSTQHILQLCVYKKVSPQEAIHIADLLGVTLIGSAGKLCGRWNKSFPKEVFVGVNPDGVVVALPPSIRRSTTTDSRNWFLIDHNTVLRSQVNGEVWWNMRMESVYTAYNHVGYTSISAFLLFTRVLATTFNCQFVVETVDGQRHVIEPIEKATSRTVVSSTDAKLAVMTELWEAEGMMTPERRSRFKTIAAKLGGKVFNKVSDMVKLARTEFPTFSSNVAEFRPPEFLRKSWRRSWAWIPSAPPLSELSSVIVDTAMYGQIEMETLGDDLVEVQLPGENIIRRVTRETYHRLLSMADELVTLEGDAPEEVRLLQPETPESSDDEVDDDAIPLVRNPVRSVPRLENPHPHSHRVEEIHLEVTVNTPTNCLSSVSMAFIKREVKTLPELINNTHCTVVVREGDYDPVITRNRPKSHMVILVDKTSSKWHVMLCRITHNKTNDSFCVRDKLNDAHRMNYDGICDGWANMFKLPATYREHITNWFGRSPAVAIPEGKVPEATIPQSELPKPAMISAVIEDLLPKGIKTTDTPLNNIAGSAVENTARSTNVKPHSVLLQTNKRNRLIRPRELYAFCVGFGNRYVANHPYQLLNILLGRYDNAHIPNIPLTPESRSLAHEMVDEYFTERKMPSILTDQEIDKLIDKFLLDERHKHYAKRWMGEGQYLQPDMATLRFSLKAIFKPANFTKGFKPTSPGQGLMQPPVYTLAYFQLAWRLIALMDEKTNNDDWHTTLTDNGVPVREFNAKFERALKDVHNAGGVDHVLDAEMYDASQGEFTRYLVWTYLHKLGVSDEFTSLYDNFVHDNRVFTPIGNSINRNTRASGMSDTLFGNGCVAKLYANYVLKGKGPSVLAYKGDDVSKTQAGITYSRSRDQAICKASNLRFTSTVDMASDFLGYLLYNGTLTPSIPRLFFKATGYACNNYDQFKEYQQALKDQLSLIGEIGEEKCIAAAIEAGEEGVLRPATPEEVESMLNAVYTMAFADKKTWKRLTNAVYNGFDLPSGHTPNFNRPAIADWRYKAPGVSKATLEERISYHGDVNEIINL